MTDIELAAAISQLIFDDPVRIPLAEFVKVYDRHRSVERRTAQFVALRALFPNDAAAVAIAVQQARDHRFFFPLWTMLLERLSATLQDDPDAQVITEAVAASTVGTMQQVLQAQGFRRVASWPGLFKAARVTGLVRVDLGGGPPASGTGFLVGPDLMLTAAHVVAGVLDGAAPRPGSADRIVVRFHNQLESSGSWPIECRVAADWLVALSPPLGDPPDLGSTESPEAAQRLDFALIRLSRKIGVEIGFLDVRNPPAANEDGRLTVIGYPGGGSDCVSDDHKVLSLEATSCRMRHTANTLEGMSGSPCIDDAGKVVALHEGAVRLPPPYNRAVRLKHIRELIGSKHPDPLSADIGPLSGIRNADARRAWIAAGANALADAGERDEWLQDVEAFDLGRPLGAESNDLFHPVFGRAPFQEWIDAACETDARQRIAFVTGRPLTGKSFSAFIAAAKLANGGHQLVIVRPETLRGRPFADVLNLILAETAAKSVATANGDLSVRPQAGTARRDLAPDVLDALETMVKGWAAGAQLWLLLDFGTDTNVTAESVLAVEGTS